MFVGPNSCLLVFGDAAVGVHCFTLGPNRSRNLERYAFMLIEHHDTDGHRRYRGARGLLKPWDRLAIVWMSSSTK